MPAAAVYFSSTVTLTADERKRLFDGAPITKLLETDESKEVAVLGAIWINAPIGRYIAAVKDIERFESGGAFRMTKRISDPSALEDFSGMRLSPEDLRDLRACRVGDCEVKLSEQGLQRFRSEVDWQAPDPAPAAISRSPRRPKASSSRRRCCTPATTSGPVSSCAC